MAAPDLLLELVHRDAAGACEAERERRDPGAQHLPSPLLFFLSLAIGWSLTRVYLVATFEYPD